MRARIRISFSGKDPIPRVPFRVVIYIGRLHRFRVRCDRVRACASISGVAVSGEGWGAAHAGELKCRRTRYLKHSHAQSGLHLHRHYYLNSYTFSSPTTCPFRGKRERERESTRSRKLSLKRAPLTAAFVIPNVQLSPSPPLSLSALRLRHRRRMKIILR